MHNTFTISPKCTQSIHLLQMKHDQNEQNMQIKNKLDIKPATDFICEMNKRNLLTSDWWSDWLQYK